MWILVEYTTYSFLRNIFSRKYKEKNSTILQRELRWLQRDPWSDFLLSQTITFERHAWKTVCSAFNGFHRGTNQSQKQNRKQKQMKTKNKRKLFFFFSSEYSFRWLKCPNYGHISDQRNLKTKSWFFVWQFERLLRLRSLLLTLVLWIRYLLCLTVCHVNWM